MRGEWERAEARARAGSRCSSDVASLCLPADHHRCCCSVLLSKNGIVVEHSTAVLLAAVEPRKIAPGRMRGMRGKARNSGQE